ncbi:MAG: TMEM14 family protein [Parachlamydiaceae bacterium]|nr:TMEM14 family protein [Parachlamydiaceae bacterium]
MNIAMGLYALLLLIGGAIGYFKAGSNMSLIMGTVTALIFAFLGLQKGRIAGYATLALTALMASFFSYRLFITHNFFPNGIIVLASLVLFLWLLRQESCTSVACCKIGKTKTEN